MNLRKIIREVDRLLGRYRRRWHRATIPDFASKPERINLEMPRQIVNPHRIWLGHDTYIGPNSSLTACLQVEDPFLSQRFEGRIVIGAGFWATAGLRVFSAELVEIDENVMVAANVFICDCQHGYMEVNVPYKKQVFASVAPVKIGSGSCLGQNVVVMPGVTIGENVIIGANSGVTRSIPAKSITIGAPARVVKFYDAVLSGWLALPEVIK
jgi:acetyltransferase-like isoleucine patch superfamily enzyme